MSSMSSSSAAAATSDTGQQLQQEQEVSLPPVHSNWWHPEKTWLDVLAGIVMSLMLKFQIPTHDETDLQAQIEYTQHFRSAIDGAPVPPTTKPWAKMAQCQIVQAQVTIPRRNKILQEWNIDDGKVAYRLSQGEEDKNPNKDVTLYVNFPETLLPPETDKPTETDSQGCLKFERHDVLEILPKDIPVVVFFHGGGFMFGHPLIFVEGSELLNTALLNKEGNGGKKKCQDVIYIRAQYSLTPEYPFPTAIVDACSIVEYLMMHSKFSHIHLSGVSAGANLALIVGLEAHRHYCCQEETTTATGTNSTGNNRQIASILAACPMLGPACDTTSYYQNQASAVVGTVQWLRWCWRAYLEMPRNNNNNDDRPEDDVDMLAKDSNRAVWKECKWNTSNTTMRRLIEPTTDLPPTLPPRIIISTNTADPMHDDDVKVVQALMTMGTEGTNKNNDDDDVVHHHDHKGSHWMGTYVDRKGYQELAADWREAIFGSSPYFS